jgi:thiamine biosynthesis lipoprotein
MKKIIFILLGALIIASCTQKTNITIIDGMAQGSTYHIVIAQDTTIGLRNAIDSLFEEIDNSVSIYNPNSLLSKINRGETDSLDSHLKICLHHSLEMSRLSDGFFDVTIMPLVRAYGFGREKAIQSPNIDSLLQFVGYDKIAIEGNRLHRLDRRVQIDLNAIAQGYTVDKLAEVFDQRGIKNYLIEIGGEIFARGEKLANKPWVVGIDSPREGNYLPGNDLIQKIVMNNNGLATSGNYRKFYTDSIGRKIVHTINPKTGLPIVSSLLSATVLAQNAATADALGTFFMIIGLENSKKFLAEHPEINALLIYDENGEFRIFRTPNLNVVE